MKRWQKGQRLRNPSNWSRKIAKSKRCSDEVSISIKRNQVEASARKTQNVGLRKIMLSQQSRNQQHTVNGKFRNQICLDTVHYPITAQLLRAYSSELWEDMILNMNTRYLIDRYISRPHPQDLGRIREEQHL